jgi:hypothetical protein
MLWLIAYVGSIVLANVTLAVVGLVPVGFGLLAPAGVLWAGIALTLRDLVQDALGRWAVLGAIVLGAGLSWLVSPAFAVASGVAFLVSELADMAVYSPLRARWWLLAILASNTVGLVVDSCIFLWLAFGSLDFLAGQLVGKAYVTLATVAALWVWRRQARPVEAGA